MPLSREFLLERGYCCHHGCLNCPYEKVVVAKLPFGKQNVVIADLKNNTLIFTNEEEIKTRQSEN